jgi:hypothetical protein
VKDLFIMVLLVAVVGLFFHDKQQTTNLTRAQSDNELLQQQLTDSQSQYNALLARTKAQSFQAGQPAPGSSQFQLKMSHLQDSGPNPLDRPPY